LRTSHLLALAVGSALTSPAWLNPAAAQIAPNTLPTGGQVSAGSASILTPNASTLQINQSSDKAILNWQSFSIGSAASVQFTQPGASSIALNRVLGSNASEIFGRLTATGQVFLSNPNGVLFAPGASVEVGALFATSLSISDANFLAGRYVFTKEGNAGAVVNRGTILTPGGYTALAAPQVRNEGLIVARLGSVALAAGERVSLDMVGDGLINVNVEQAALNASVLNSGTIQADGGRVILSARSANALLDTVINNTGAIRANALVERNGEIILDGGAAGVVLSSGALDAIGGAVTITGATVYIANLHDANGEISGGIMPLIQAGPGVLEVVGAPAPSAPAASPPAISIATGSLALARATAASTIGQITSAATLSGYSPSASGPIGLQGPMAHRIEATGVSLPPGVTLQ
jgi:filamentous hemagglutinin family protein